MSTSSSSNNAQFPVYLDADSTLAGLNAVSRISQFAASGQISSQSDIPMTVGTDTDTLVSALRLSLDVSTIKRLAKPAVVKGCLDLMRITSNRRPRPVSPFSHEYERMCFRLLVVSLNLCLLDRWDKLDGLLEAPGLIHSQQAAYTIADAAVPAEVLDQLIVSDTGGNCDWVFGWSATTQQLQQPLLLSQSDISYLVDYLWNDRKLWLQAMISYANPGLSGLMFMFSHYVAYVRHIQHNLIWEGIRNRALELIYRYTLIADRDQLPAACAIADANAYQKTLADIVPMQVDVEDSRAIMAAYIKRFSFDDALDMIKRRDPDVMLRFVPYAIDEGCQGLLPELLNHTIKYGWLYVLEEGDVDEGMAGEGMSDKLKKFVPLQFNSLRMLVKPLEPSLYRLAFSTKEQILNVVKHEDLLDWTIRMIIRLKPSDSDQRFSSLRMSYGFFVAISEGVATDKLERYFIDYVPTWSRFERHLVIMGVSMCATPTGSHREHYEECLNTWFKIAHRLGIIPAIERHVAIACRSPRCPYAYLYAASQFSCADRADKTYCNNRCQSIAWKFGDIPSSR